MKRYLIYILCIGLLVSCSTPLIITEKNIELLIIKEDGKVGYIDQRGKVIIEPTYDEGKTDYFFEDEITEYFTSEDYAIVKKDGKFGLIDGKGNIVLDIEYDYLTDEYNGTYGTVVDGKHGIISHTGEVLIPHIFDSNYFIQAREISPGEIAGQYVLYDPKDSSILETDYDYISPFFVEFAEVRKNNRSGLIDTLGNVVLEIKYDEIDIFYKDRIPVVENTFAKYVNLEGENIFNRVFDNCDRFEDAYAVVGDNGLYGVIDTTGKLIIPFKYTGLYNEGNGIFEFSTDFDDYEIDDYCGLININQDTILECKYAYIFEYEGFVEVEMEDGKCGVIELKNQQEIIPIVFDAVDYYTDMPTKVFFSDNAGNKFLGYINKRNKIVWSNNDELLKEKLKGKRE